MLSGLRRWWASLNLVGQFAVMAIAVLFPGMMAIGWWISDRIGEAVVHNTATALALYMDGLLAPLSPEIKQTGHLADSSRELLDQLLEQARSDSRIVSMKVWNPDGTIIYSSFPDMVGKQFPISDDFAKAMGGQVGAELGAQPHVEDSNERREANMLLEVYSPVRDRASRKIVAISEFYANGADLSADVWRTTLTTWGIVAAVAATMVLALSGLVARGSQTIIRQRQLLADQVTRLKSLLDQNETLRTSLHKANEDVATINERILQQLGSDLHDGPAQHLAYVAMRISKLRKHFSNRPAGERELAEVSRIVGNALEDVRRTSQGLLLPELEGATLAEAIKLAVTTHEDLTGSKVQLTLKGKCGALPTALILCAYRVAQEALNNAFKHAGGVGQAVTLDCIDDVIVRIQDSGKGFDSTLRPTEGLGLTGMRARIESLGGTLTVASSSNQGTTITARFPRRELGRREGKYNGTANLSGNGG